MSPCYKHAQVKAVQFKNGGRKAWDGKSYFIVLHFPSARSMYEK